MMLSDFILLTVEEKKLVILHEGILIAKRKDDDCIVFLFQLDNYYVETFCNRSNKEIEEFRISANTGLLNPYLETISIEGILDHN